MFCNDILKVKTMSLHQNFEFDISFFFIWSNDIKAKPICSSYYWFYTGIKGLKTNIVFLRSKAATMLTMAS